MKRYKPVVVLLCSILILGCATNESDLNKTTDEKEKTEETVMNNSDITGTWKGAITIQGQNLEITLRFSKAGDEYTGSIDIPAQNTYGYAVTDISVQEKSVKFILPSPQADAEFEGVLEGSAISGKFIQGPASGTFSLEKTSDSAETAAPKAPGTEKEVKLQVEEGTLYGTLLIPPGEGPFPAVLIIPGSGPADRNGNSAITGRNNSLLLLSHELAKEGFASLRIDKRGVGDSIWQGLMEDDLTLDIYVSDALKWLHFLEEQSATDKAAIIGHSEGALVSALAVRNNGAEALVSIAGMGMTFGDTLRRQLTPYPEDVRGEAERIIKSLEAGKMVTDISDSQIIQSLFRPSVQPYMISIMQHDPAEVVSEIEAPVLIVQGTKDLQVSMEDAEKLAAAGENAELAVIQDMNHVLKEVENLDDNKASYGNPEFPLAEGLVKKITDFLPK